jgi:hypothetical protein
MHANTKVGLLDSKHTIVYAMQRQQQHERLLSHKERQCATHRLLKAGPRHLFERQLGSGGGERGSGVGWAAKGAAAQPEQCVLHWPRSVLAAVQGETSRQTCETAAAICCVRQHF